MQDNRALHKGLGQTLDRRERNPAGARRRGRQDEPLNAELPLK